MDGIKIDDRIINPDHIVCIDLNAQGGFDHEKTECAVKIVLSVLEGEVSAGFLDPLTLTYTGPKAEVLRSFLDKMFPCKGRGIQLSTVSSVEDVEPKSSSGIGGVLETSVPLESDGEFCALDICNKRVETKGNFCSKGCAILAANKITCLLDVCNVRVKRNGNFCSDECAELFAEQIPF